MMTWRFFLLIVVVCMLVPTSAKSQEARKKESKKPNPNQVYIKLIMPTASADGEKEQHVESWIAEDLKERGQAKFSAVTGWVPLDLSPFESTDLWDGKLGDHHYCPVGADIPERKKGQIKVLARGWGPDGAEVTFSLKDEVGGRAIAGVKQHKTEIGMPYVALLIGPPLETPAAPKESRK